MPVAVLKLVFLLATDEKRKYPLLAFQREGYAFFNGAPPTTTTTTQQGAHLEQSTPYYVLSELTASLMAIIVEPDRKGRFVMEEFSDAMPPEVRCQKLFES